MSQLKFIVNVGCPASGKSFWAKQEIAKAPNEWLRINNDDFRSSFNGSVYSPDYEKLVSATRTFLIKEGLSRGKNIILDNVNCAPKHWQEAVKLVEESNRDCQIFEKIFYEPLETLLERDSKRTGIAQVGEKVIRKFFKEFGGDQLKYRKSRIEVFSKNRNCKDKVWVPMVQDTSLPRAVIFDIDSTTAKIGDRSPYDASQCHLTDSPIETTIELIKLYFNEGYKIIFCSGRMEKDREPTMSFLNKHLPNISYLLLMRSTNDQRKDCIIKEELFNSNINNKYYVKAVYDDRLSVCRLWHGLGLQLYRVGDPDSNF